MRRGRITPWSEGIDLVPLIDCVFLILLFFILCGRLTTDQRPEQITVPPGRTAQKADTTLERVVLNVRGGERPALSFGEGGWIDLAEGWAPVRQRLDRIWELAGKRQRDGLTVAEAVLEIRADAALPFRLVQELQMVAAGTVDGATLEPRPAALRPFIHLDFAAVPPG